ncbi:VWA domain-containing protein [Amycolatopsis methanolica]|uniref:VWA domain-containing protein n=1 Tax=Amycolatopsis methanolica TaxID=1814 RepID=UPI00342DACEF
MRKALAPVALGLRLRSRSGSGAELDLDSAIRREVDLRAGWQDPAADRIWRSPIRALPELSVVSILDHSGSTGGVTSGNVPRADLATTAALLLAAFDSLGTPSAAFGFRSYGRTRVVMTPLKLEDQRFDHRARRALAGLEPGGFTRLGAAIRFATARLDDCRSPVRRLIILHSDGYPFDDGYEMSYAVADTRAAVAEAARAHCGLLWIRPRRPDETALRCFGDTPQVAAEDVVTSPAALASEMARAPAPAGSRHQTRG